MSLAFSDQYAPVRELRSTALDEARVDLRRAAVDYDRHVKDIELCDAQMIEMASDLRARQGVANIFRVDELSRARAYYNHLGSRKNDLEVLAEVLAQEHRDALEVLAERFRELETVDVLSRRLRAEHAHMLATATQKEADDGWLIGQRFARGAE